MNSKDDELDFHWQNYKANKSIKSRNWLCCRYHRLVHSTRQRLFPHYKEWEDMEQEGAVALLQAIVNFQPDRGAKFPTYAINCIKGRFYKIIARRSGIEKWPLSLDDEAAGAEWLVCGRPTPEQSVLKQCSREFVRERVEKLPPHLSEVMIKRYWEDKTLKQIASELSRSTPSIFGREKRALRILREEIPDDIFTK